MASVEKFEEHCWKDVVPAADMKLHAAQARATFVGPCPALLALDLCNCVYRGGLVSPHDNADAHPGASAPESHGRFAHDAIEPIRRLLAAARGARLPIFYGTRDERPNAYPPAARATPGRAAAPLPDDYQILPAFKPEPADVIIYRQGASALEGTPLRSHLKLLGIESLIVCGAGTSACVRATVADAYSGGLHVAVVEECTFDRTELAHKLNLFDLHHSYADVMHLDEVLGHLARLAGGQASGKACSSSGSDERGMT
jgi:maleamate amidohydrolase